MHLLLLLLCVHCCFLQLEGANTCCFLLFVAACSGLVWDAEKICSLYARSHEVVFLSSPVVSGMLPLPSPFLGSSRCPVCRACFIWNEEGPASTRTLKNTEMLPCNPATCRPYLGSSSASSHMWLQQIHSIQLVGAQGSKISSAYTLRALTLHACQANFFFVHLQC